MTSNKVAANIASSPRRKGRRDGETFNRLLDAVEDVLRVEGGAAITSRIVAERAGLKQQLVYYYFESVDDMLLAAFKRRTDRDLGEMAQIVASERPAQALWSKLNDKVDAKLAFEFAALANRHNGVREEAGRYGDISRRMEAAGIARQLREKDVDLGPLTPTAAAFFMYAASFVMAREISTGVTQGHDDVRAFFDWVMRRLD